MHEGGPQGFYGTGQGAASQPTSQYPPAVPPERQLPSSGSAVQNAPQGAFGGRATQPYNYMPGQEQYQQYPQRSLAPVTGSSTGMNFPTTSGPQGSMPGEVTSPGTYNPQAGYGQYSGQHHYR